MFRKQPATTTNNIQHQYFSCPPPLPTSKKPDHSNRRQVRRGSNPPSNEEIRSPSSTTYHDDEFLSRSIGTDRSSLAAWHRLSSETSIITHSGYLLKRSNQPYSKPRLGEEIVSRTEEQTEPPEPTSSDYCVESSASKVISSSTPPSSSFVDEDEIQGIKNTTSNNKHTNNNPISRDSLLIDSQGGSSVIGGYGATFQEQEKPTTSAKKACSAAPIERTIAMAAQFFGVDETEDEGEPISDEKISLNGRKKETRMIQSSATSSESLSATQTTRERSQPSTLDSTLPFQVSSSSSSSYQRPPVTQPLHHPAMPPPLPFKVSPQTHVTKRIPIPKPYNNSTPTLLPPRPKTPPSPPSHSSMICQIPPPADQIDPIDGHIWRSKYCILENGILYFYRNAEVGESFEAQRERDEYGDSVSLLRGASSVSGSFSSQRGVSGGSGASGADDLSKSPMTRPLHLLMGGGGGAARSSEDAIIIWEKRVALNKVNEVRSAELEYGKHSFELLAQQLQNGTDDEDDDEEASGTVDKLILRAESTDEMNEWLFQFHRSLASFMKHMIVDLVGSSNPNERRKIVGGSFGGGPPTISPLSLPYAGNPSSGGGRGGGGGVGAMELLIPPYGQFPQSRDGLLFLQQKEQFGANSDLLAPLESVVSSAPLSHGHGRSGMHRSRANRNRRQASSATETTCSSMSFSSSSSSSVAVTIPRALTGGRGVSGISDLSSATSTSNRSNIEEVPFHTFGNSNNRPSGASKPLSEQMGNKTSSNVSDVTADSSIDKGGLAASLNLKNKDVQGRAVPESSTLSAVGGGGGGGGKYIPPHLRKKKPGSKPAGKYIPPHLRNKSKKSGNEERSLNISRDKDQADSAGGIFEMSVEDNNKPSISAPAHSQSHNDSHTPQYPPFFTSVNHLEMGGCADPRYMPGSILDPRFIPRQSSKMGKVRAEPYGGLGGGYLKMNKGSEELSHASEEKKNNEEVGSAGADRRRGRRRNIRWEVGAVSECGIRESNEDCFLISNDLVGAFDSLDKDRPRSTSGGDVAAGTHEADKKTSSSMGLFAIFDGHCGNQAARYSGEKLPSFLSRHLGHSNREPPTVALRKAILELDDQFCQLCTEDGRDWDCGTTALVVLVVEDTIVVGNLGDSRGVFCRLGGGEEEEGWSVLERDGYGMGGDAEPHDVNDRKQSPAGTRHPSQGDCHWKEITQIHSPSRPDERSRIQNANGWITTETEIPISQLIRMDFEDVDVLEILKRCFSNRFPGAPGPGRILQISRVCGELAVSRAIGDREFKVGFNKVGEGGAWECPLFLPYPEGHERTFVGDLVSGEPEMEEVKLGGGEEECLILACDGLWDVMDLEDAVRITRGLLFEKRMTAKKAAARLAELAIHLGSSDNITVIVIRFFNDDDNGQN